MKRIRPAAVAGAFYTGDPRALAGEVAAMLEEAEQRKAQLKTALQRAQSRRRTVTFGLWCAGVLCVAAGGIGFFIARKSQASQ